MKKVYCSQKKYDKIVYDNKVDKDTLHCITDVACDIDIECVDEEDLLSPDEEVIHKQNKTIERLQEQLEEANNVIKLYYKPIVVTRQITDDYILTEEIPTDSSVAFNYLEKWGVK